jgi:flavin reductase (DIM6/NTAB) family NADH-FMN oxidoreductase RutF
VSAEPVRPDAFEPPDPSAYRRAMGRFASGVAIVTTRAGEIDHAMTVNAFTSVSLEPMLVLVCVEVEARFHDAVIDSGVWGVSVLDGSGRAASDWLATRGRPLHGQLDRLPHHVGPVTGVSLLDASLATMECRTTAVYPGGDHSILLGEVVGIATRDSDDGALVHFRGRYDRLH